MATKGIVYRRALNFAPVVLSHDCRSKIRNLKPRRQYRKKLRKLGEFSVCVSHGSEPLEQWRTIEATPGQATPGQATPLQESQAKRGRVEECPRLSLRTVQAYVFSACVCVCVCVCVLPAAHGVTTR